MTIADGVLRLTLDNPKTVNALDAAMLTDLTTMLEDAALNPAVNVVTIQGAGRGFCSGLSKHAVAAAESSTDRLHIDDAGAKLIGVLGAYPKPTVALLHGAVVGGGAVIAVACDIRLARDDTFFWMPEILHGSPVLWSGVGLMVREIGLPAVRELAMLGQRADLNWSKEKGLVHHIFSADSFEADAHEAVRRLADMHAPGMALLKKDLNRVADELSSQTTPFTGEEVLSVVESRHFLDSIGAM